MKSARHTATRPRLRLALATVVGVLLTLGVSLPAQAEGDDPGHEGAMTTCTVRIEHDGLLAEAFADGMTVEEAEDQALEGACALRCVSTAEGGDEDDEGGEDALRDDSAGSSATEASPSRKKRKDPGPRATPGTSAKTPAKEALAEDDPDGVEACIAACSEAAILIGTICIDEASQTVFAEGAFDPDDEGGGDSDGEGDDREGEDDGGEGREGEDTAGRPEAAPQARDDKDASAPSAPAKDK